MTPKHLYLTDQTLVTRFAREADGHGVKSATTYLGQCLRVLTDLAGDDTVQSYLMRLQKERGDRE